VSDVVYVSFLSEYSPAWADSLAPRVGQVLGHPLLKTEAKVDLEPYYAPERNQYHATLILAGLLRHLPEDGSKIVGVTALDLFVPVLTFVFGQAQLNGHGAVVSTFRLKNEYYGLPADEELTLARTIKEVVHELGHAFGLVHCRDYRCVMKASTYVEDVDLKEASFCSACRELLDRTNNQVTLQRSS
jgi:archaemetzincin